MVSKKQIKKPSVKEINEILKNTDWDDYHQKVLARTIPQVEAYRRASVKSLERSGNRVLL